MTVPLPVAAKVQPPTVTAPEAAPAPQQEVTGHPAGAVAGAAETAAAAQAAAAQPAATAAAPLAPEGAPPPDPDPDEERRTEPPAWRVRRHRRLPRLRIGSHVAPDDALERLQLSVVSFGLRLGRDQSGAPVVLPLFRPEPTRVVLVGQAAAALLALRALRLGARLVVLTHDTGGWIDLGRRATGRTDRVAVLSPGSAVVRVGTADAPVLRLLDAEAATGAPPPPDPALPGWTTELSVLPRVTPATVDRLAPADVVLTRRLSPVEANLACSARRLAGAVPHLLQVLHDDMLAVLTPGASRYAWIGPSQAEREILSARQRP